MYKSQISIKNIDFFEDSSESNAEAPVVKILAISLALQIRSSEILMRKATGKAPVVKL